MDRQQCATRKRVLEKNEMTWCECNLKKKNMKQKQKEIRKPPCHHTTFNTLVFRVARFEFFSKYSLSVLCLDEMYSVPNASNHSMER